MKSVTVKNGVNIKNLEHGSGKGKFLNPILDGENTYRVHDTGQKTWQVLFQALQGGWQGTFQFAYRMEIGRTPSPQGGVKLVIPGDTMVSGNHAVVFAQNGRLYIEDCNSKNHTFLNGRMIKGPVELTNGVSIRVGRSEFRVYLKMA